MARIQEKTGGEENMNPYYYSNISSVFYIGSGKNSRAELLKIINRKGRKKKKR